MFFAEADKSLATIKAHEADATWFADSNKEMLTSPNELSEQFVDLPTPEKLLQNTESEMKKALRNRRRSGKTFKNPLPHKLRCRSYAEGMKEIWNLTDQASHFANLIASGVRTICVTVVRTELGVILATGRDESHPEFAKAVRGTGYYLAATLEDVFRYAHILADPPDLSKIQDPLGRPKLPAASVYDRQESSNKRN